MRSQPVSRSLRSHIKRILYTSGALSAYHRMRNRRRLTVAMFHRVLAKSDPRWTVADPTWTISDNLFEECLTFFARHYNLISLDQLLAARIDSGCLPDRPLLITFDDGWADNEEFALRALRRRNLPAVVFVVAAGVGRGELWDESLRRAYRAGSFTEARWRAIWSVVAGDRAAPLLQSRREVEQLIAKLVPFDANERERLLAGCLGENRASEMLTAAQLRDLQAQGVAIGSHGLSHAPIPRTTQVSEELSESRVALRNLTGTDIAALSFPHGVYDQNCVATARAFGYELLFTSDSVLNCVRPGQPLNDVLGRIPIYEQEIASPDGRLSPERLAFSLFFANTR